MFVDPMSRPHQQQRVSPTDRSRQHDQQRVNPRDQQADPGRTNVSPWDRPADLSRQNVSPWDRPADSGRTNVSPTDPDRQHANVNVQPWQAQDNWFARERSASPSHDTDKRELWEPRSETQRRIQDDFMGGRQRRSAVEEEAARQQRVREPEEGRDFTVSTPETREDAWDRVERAFADQGADWHQARHADVPDPGQRVDQVPLAATDLRVGETAYKTADGIFYQQKGGTWKAVYPPLGAVVAAPPMGYSTVRVGSESLFYYQGAFYRMNEGTWDYTIVKPPEGAVVPYLPDGAEKSSRDGLTVFYWDQVIYQPTYHQGKLVYEVAGYR
jgi:hypothetical protein